MLRIIPCHNTVSIRSPVVSFMIEVPRDRLFEIACTSDPRLFGAKHRRHRTAENFFTSRREGWMRARSGSTTYVLPRDAVQGMLSGRRIHYVLAAFGGDPPQAAFSTPPGRFESAPSIGVIADGPVRLLSARRFGGAPAASVLSWTADALSDDFDSDMDVSWDEEEEQGPPPSGPSLPLQSSHVVMIEIRDASGAVSKLSHEYPVEPSGAIRMPRLAPIEAKNVLAADLRKTIHDALIAARVFPRASVNVTLSENMVPYGVKLAPNDRIFIRMLDDGGNVLPPSGGYQLSTTGEIDLPFLGLITAKEQTLEELQATIIEGLSKSSSVGLPTIHVSASELP
jgi:protein involved in polysaccharide export with SLBB domain